jgi:hypothetical protein
MGQEGKNWNFTPCHTKKRSLYTFNATSIINLKSNDELLQIHSAWLNDFNVFLNGIRHEQNRREKKDFFLLLSSHMAKRESTKKRFIEVSGRMDFIHSFI